MVLEKTINKLDAKINKREYENKRDDFSEDILRKIHPTFPSIPNHLQILTDNCRKPVGGLQCEILGGSHKFQ